MSNLHRLASVAGFALLFCLTLSASAAGAEEPLGDGCTDAGRILMLEDERVLSLDDGKPDLKYYFKSEAGDLRRRAALAAGRIGDPEGIRLLSRALKDDDDAVRQAAAFALGEVDDPAAIRPLRRALSDDNEGVRALAAEALSKLEDRSALSSLERLLRRESAPTGSEQVLERLLYTAWRLEPKGWTEDVLPLLTRSQRIRAAATYFLMRRPEPAAETALLHLVGADNGKPEATLIASWAARGLGGLESKRSLIALLDAADTGPEQVAIEAVRAVARHRHGGEAVGTARLAVPLARRELPVQIAVLQTLASLGGPDAASPALSDPVLDRVVALTDSKMPAAGEALKALAAHAPSLAVPRIQAILTVADDWRLRAAAADSLAKLPVADATPLFLLGIDTQPATVRWHLLAAGSAHLSESSSDDTRQRLGAIARWQLDARDPVVRAVAAELLIESGKATAEDLQRCYRRGLEDGLNDAALACMEGLAKLGSEEEIQAVLDDALNRPDPVLRRSAGALWQEKGFGPVPRTRIYPISQELEKESLEDRLRAYSALASGELLPRGARIHTEMGSIRLRLYGEDAPLTVHNFTTLAADGYFDGLEFHRVVPNFVIQDGDPRRDGWGGPGWAIRDEINLHRYDAGVLGMALSGPDTGGSQWFLTLSPQPHLDGGYTVFGRVEGNLHLLHRIPQGTRIHSIELVK